MSKRKRKRGGRKGIWPMKSYPDSYNRVPKKEEDTQPTRHLTAEEVAARAFAGGVPEKAGDRVAKLIDTHHAMIDELFEAGYGVVFEASHKDIMDIGDKERVTEQGPRDIWNDAVIRLAGRTRKSAYGEFANA